MANLYQPLHDTKPACQGSKISAHYEFRLITLRSGAAGSRIVCELNNSTLGLAQNHYEALSYAWGDPKKSESITVNGQLVLITRNLFQSLLHLRHRRTDRQLWIDALCIDQLNLNERNLQVQRMGIIYTLASKVVVFLGPEAELSSSAMTLLEQVGSLEKGDYNEITNLLEDNSCATLWQALLRLFERSWWTRAWIVQEYVVAHDVVFLCGDRRLPGQVFGRALENLVDYRFKAIVAKEHEHLIRHVAKTPIHHLWSTRCIYQDPIRRNSLHVLNVLYKFRGSQCSDARDKVYSVWGLINQDPLLAPDYSKSAIEVYQSVVRAAIESSGNLEVLTHHNRSMESLLKFPKWCSDWTIMRGKRILLWPNGYRACGKFKRACAELANDALVLRGVEIARISHLKFFESDDFKNRLYIRQELSELEKSASQPPYPERCLSERLDAIYQTFVAARIRPDGPSGDAIALLPGEADRMWTAWCAAPDESQLSEWNKDAKLYAEALYSALCGRCVLFTDTGRLGLVDGTARVGDRIFVFAGGEVPFCIHYSNRSGVQTNDFVGEW